MDINYIIKTLERFVKTSLKYKEDLNVLQKKLRNDVAELYKESGFGYDFKNCYNGIDRFITKLTQVISELDELKVDISRKSQESIKVKFRDLGNVILNGSEYAQGSIETSFSKKIFSRVHSYSLKNKLDLEQLNIVSLNEKLTEFFSNKGEVVKTGFMIVDGKL